jgi:drug/metabolite transporter (DMT)-like permease
LELFVQTSLRRFGTPIALLAQWLIFGSAFIGIKVGVSHVPPLLFSGSRLLLAGALLLAWSAWRSGWRLDLRRGDVAAAAVIGLGLMVGGQGSVSWASQSVAPGIVAVLVTLVPIWTALLSWLALRRPVPLPAMAGMAAGFCGVVFLASPAGGGATPLGPALLLAAGSLSWAAASVYATRTEITRRPIVATGIQLVAGGGAQMVIGAALGEPSQVHLQALLGPAALAWLFLLGGASLIGFPVYTWLLTNTSAAVANASAYVSPVVALGLGWLLLGSSVRPQTLLAAGVILAGVALIVTTGGRRREPAGAAGPEAERRAA